MKTKNVQENLNFVSMIFLCALCVYIGCNNDQDGHDAHPTQPRQVQHSPSKPSIGST